MSAVVALLREAAPPPTGLGYDAVRRGPGGAAAEAAALSALVRDAVTLAVQVNGKLRDTLTLPKGLAREDAEAAALASEKIVRALEGKTPRKVIVVPDRLVNVVA